MAWVAVDEDGNECVYQFRPKRNSVQFVPLYEYSMWLVLPKGSIKKLIGCGLSWKDNPVELKADTVEKITIDVEDYRRYLSYANYIENWAGTIYKCPRCGALNPEGYNCMECGYMELSYE